jgi:hypothetical protein
MPAMGHERQRTASSPEAVFATPPGCTKRPERLSIFECAHCLVMSMNWRSRS